MGIRAFHAILCPSGFPEVSVVAAWPIGDIRNSPLDLTSLDVANVRQYMLDELELDMARGRVYTSPRLSGAASARFPDMLRAAFAGGTPATLLTELSQPGLLNEYETRNTKNGPIQARVPITAAEILAEGEFNRFYARGVCRQAIQSHDNAVEVYRAKVVRNPRAESQAKIGIRISPAALLTDLQTHPGVDTALGIPAGPNSGLSVRLI